MLTYCSTKNLPEDRNLEIRNCCEIERSNTENHQEVTTCEATLFQEFFVPSGGTDPRLRERRLKQVDFDDRRTGAAFLGKGVSFVLKM